MSYITRLDVTPYTNINSAFPSFTKIYGDKIDKNYTIPIEAYALQNSVSSNLNSVNSNAYQKIKYSNNSYSLNIIEPVDFLVLSNNEPSYAIMDSYENMKENYYNNLKMQKIAKASKNCNSNNSKIVYLSDYRENSYESQATSKNKIDENV